MRNKTIFIFFFILFSAIGLFPISNLSAEDSTTASTTPEEYSDNEFPDWAKDLRRTEIISFGSMPFVTLGVTLGLSTYKYVTGASTSFPNPFNKSSTSYTTDEQIQILKYSSLISLGLGVTDLIINLIQRFNSQKKLKQIQDSKEKVIVTPITPEEAGILLKKNSEPESSPADDQNQDTSTSPAE